MHLDTSWLGLGTCLICRIIGCIRRLDALRTMIPLLDTKYSIHNNTIHSRRNLKRLSLEFVCLDSYGDVQP